MASEVGQDVALIAATTDVGGYVECPADEQWFWITPAPISAPEIIVTILPALPAPVRLALVPQRGRAAPRPHTTERAWRAWTYGFLEAA